MLMMDRWRDQEVRLKRVSLGALCVAVVFISGCSLFQSGILFQETWSDPNTTSWWLGVGNAGDAWVEDGQYHILTKRVGTWMYWNNEQGPFGNAQIDIDVKHEAGTDDEAAAGLVFRFQDTGNTYLFLVSVNGYFEVAKWVANDWTTLNKWTTSSAIHAGPASNHLTVIADRTFLTFLVNGTQVADLMDGSFSAGKIGVIVAAYQDGADVVESFDNLTVREVK